MSLTTIAEWREFARTGFVLEADDSYDLFVYKNNEFVQRIQKPPNWRTIVEVVNGHRAPIRPALRDAIFDLFDRIVPIDARDPWIALAKLKENKQLEMTLRDNVTIVLQRNDLTKSVAVVVDGTAGADAICARWNRLGFEHERIILLATMLDSIINFADPWGRMMQQKALRDMKLVYDGSTKLEVLEGGKPVRILTLGGVSKPFAELVRMFNEGEVPPGCTTDWEPYYSAAEAMDLIKEAYGKPEFDRLISRIRDGKLRRC